MCREHFKDLAGDRRVDAGVALVGQHLDAVVGFGCLGAVVDEIAPSVGEADIADVFHGVALHAVGDDLDQQRGGLRNGDRPLIGRIRLSDQRGDGNHRHLQLGRDRHHRDGRRGGCGADQEIDFLFLDQLARVAGRGGGIGAVVELDQPDLLAVDLALVFHGGLDAASVRDADRGARSTERRHESDRHIGLSVRGRDEAADECSQTQYLAHCIPLG